jgi:hypothetical protein
MCRDLVQKGGKTNDTCGRKSTGLCGTGIPKRKIHFRQAVRLSGQMGPALFLSGVENRGRFIIDPDGVIQGYEVLTPPVGRNVSETLRQVQAFQLVRETKGAQATPSGWRPGKLTLKPGPDLVGKVWEVWKTDMAFD